MSNILDYIKNRGNLSLIQDSFNEIDNLILSRFSYLPFDNIIKEDEIVTIKELSRRFKNADKTNMKILWNDDINLFPLIGESERFGNMQATKYINKIETSLEKQFSAITILMPDDTIYISYRGTDNTLIGWKEDFNMSFKSHIAAQVDSVKYLEEISELYPQKKIRVGGHSKGGNLAIYASTFASSQVKQKVVDVYNNDGPGFRDDIIETNEYQDNIHKIKTYIPYSSVIGRLLKNEGTNIIVMSNQKGIMQHDLYSWELLDNHFIYVDELSNGSQFVDSTIKNWLENVENEKRELVIDVLFDIIAKTEAQTLQDLKLHFVSNARKIMRSYRELDDETKKIVLQTLHELIRITKENINLSINIKSNEKGIIINN